MEALESPTLTVSEAAAMNSEDFTLPNSSIEGGGGTGGKRTSSSPDGKFRFGASDSGKI